MRRPTPSNPDFDLDRFEGDVGLGGAQLDEPAVGDLTLTDNIVGAVPIYPHGFKIRFGVGADVNIADVLTNAGCTDDSTDYRTIRRRDGSVRYVARGSVSLNQRRPHKKGRRTPPLVSLNRAWKTNLYSVEFELRDGTLTVDLHGVRITDCKKFFEDVLGLDAGDYSQRHYRRAERYMVLSVVEARRVAEAVGATGESFRVRGPFVRKALLVRDYPIPIVVRTRSRTTATVNIYRIEPGATTAFKVEIALSGKTNRRQEFNEDDVRKLDDELLKLVATLDLHPFCKPARWEPRSLDAPIEAHRDPDLARMRMSAWQGRPVPEPLRRTVEANCNNLDDPNGDESDAMSRVSRLPERIREDHSPVSTTLEGSSSGYIPLGTFDSFHPQLYVREGDAPFQLPSRRSPNGRRGGPLQALVDGLLPGHMTEVIFQDDRDPSDFIEEIIQTFPGAVGVGVLDFADSARLSVQRLASEYPITGDSTVVVLVVDASIACRIHECYSHFDEDTLSFSPGPLIPHTDFWEKADNTPLIWKGIGALLAGDLEALGTACEQEGARVVLVTEDARPDHGRGPWRASHRCRDSRVRSTIGDAGRYAAHLRYLVESDTRGGIMKIAVVKDMAEGLTGRPLYQRP